MDVVVDLDSGTMTHPWRRLITTALFVAALASTPLAVTTVASPAVSSACAPGETGITNGCAPFCLPGRELDLKTGLCLPGIPPPPPFPPPIGGAPW